MIPNITKRRPKRITDATESQIQKSIIEYMRATKAHKQGWIFYHVPNDGRHGKAQKINNWQMGVLSGVPDIAITSPQGRSMFIEVKTPSGVHSDYQNAFKSACDGQSVPNETARSLDDAIIILNAWGFPVLQSEAA